MASNSPAKITGEGLVARFAPIKGVTPKAALAKRLWLPCLLNTPTITETALHNEYDTIAAGRFSQPAMGGPDARQLQSLSPDTMVVAFDPPYLVASGQEPLEVREGLRRILRYRKPVHLLVTINPNPWGRPPELDMFCTFRQRTVEVRPGEAETHYISLQISEWRDPSGKVRASTPAGTSSRKKGVSLPTTHRLRATDTLASLSFEYYGRYDYWRHIRDANGISTKFGQKTPLVTLPGRFKVGFKIKIPAVPKAKKRATGGAGL